MRCSLAGNGVKKVLVGQNGFMATPAMSALIRRQKLYGGLIMSASHNPAGPKEDWGIKFNYKSGEPAPEKITNAVFDFTKKISELKMADLPDVDLTKLGTTKFGDFEVEVVDPVEDYFAVLQEVRKLRSVLILPKSFCFVCCAVFPLDMCADRSGFSRSHNGLSCSQLSNTDL